MGKNWDTRTINSLVLELNELITSKNTEKALDTSAQLFGFMLGRIGVMQTQIDMLCNSTDTL